MWNYLELLTIVGINYVTTKAIVHIFDVDTQTLPWIRYILPYFEL